MPEANNSNAKDWAAVAAKSKEKTSNAAQNEEETKAEEGLARETPELTELSAAECEIKLNTAEKKADEYMNKYLRLLADMENAQRRAERDIDNSRNYAIEKFALEILTVVDNLERTLETKADENELVKKIYVGVELTLKSLLESLQKFGIEQINPVGEAFNHDQHAAVSMREDSTAKPNTVIQVLQRGYLLKKDCCVQRWLLSRNNFVITQLLNGNNRFRAILTMQHIVCSGELFI